MDGIFGYVNGNFEVSLADSTMMWIVHYAMNKAQEKMKAKTGVIERLNEISKFYELAVMQLEGCLSIVHAETESSFLESNHEEVLDDLRDIKDRLQWRLKESELAIVEKDKELTQRLENELQLRHALELKERQLVSLGVSNGNETSSLNAENDQTRNELEDGNGDGDGDGDGGNDDGNGYGDGDGDGDFYELRTSLDQQKLETHDMLSELEHNGIGRKKIDEMGSDIDILKQTMDLAFVKMQSALALREMGSKEREWKLTIEKNVMSILIGSFMREFQEDIEAELKRDENQVLKVWKRHWPRLMNEFTSLQHELAIFHETYPEDSDCSSLSSPIKPSSPSKPSSPEASHEMANKFSQKMEEMDKAPGEEESEDGSNYVAKLIKSHESIIRRKSEENNLSKHGILQERKASYTRRRKELNRVRERIHVVTEKLDSFIYRNARLGESLFNQRPILDVEPFQGRKEVAKKEHNTMQNLISDMCGSIDDKVEEFNIKFCNFDLEKQIQEHVYKYYLREVINEWNENIEKQTIKRKIRDDINLTVLSEAVMDINANQEFSLTKEQDKINSTINEDICKIIFRQTVDEFNKVIVGCKADSGIREHINQIVFGETLKIFVNMTSFASKKRENGIQNNFLDKLHFITIESFLKEDVCMVVFKAMIKEWELKLDNYYVENYIREMINQVVMVETLNDAFLFTMEVQGNSIKDNFSTSTMMLNQGWKVEGEENLTIILLESLLSCFEAEENLMLSAKSEIKEQCRELDLGSERGDLHEHEIFEDLITGEEQTFSSLTSKVENVLQQLGIGKALLKELGTSLGHSLRDSESFQSQMSTNEEGQLRLSSSAFMPLLNLILTFAEFGAMICQKFEMMNVRLEKMKCCLDPVIELVNCLRSKTLIYQKAFFKRCQNLQKAEAEVDLLGDQVDALLTLLEKIYATLHQHAPALQQYFEVYNILELIKKELISGAVEAESVLM
uniref:WPP domain-associated protein n=1 Tax=Cajanus cajan TaxID=3821 RepID=A0A151TBS3_CAJCA|nr:WPP domain-associated protein [Cajanus cajan]